MAASVSFPKIFTKENITEAFDYYAEHDKRKRAYIFRWVLSSLFTFFWIPLSLGGIFAGLLTADGASSGMFFLSFFKGAWDALFLPLYNLSSLWYVQLPILLAAVIAPPVLFALIMRFITPLLIRKKKFTRIAGCGDEIKKAKWLLKKKFTYSFNSFYFSCVIIGICYLFCGVLFWSGFLSANENAGEVLLKDFPLGIISCLLLSLLEGLPALLLGFLVHFVLFYPILGRYKGMDERDDFYCTVDAYWESVDPEEARIRQEARERLRREAEEYVWSDDGHGSYEESDADYARRKAIWEEIVDMEIAQNVAQSVNATVPGDI